MKIRIVAGPGTDKTAWNAAKGFFLMVVLVALIHPITRGRTSGDTSEARTVLPAKILAADMYTLSTEAGGRILTVMAEPGSLVKAGDVLAEIRNPELDNVIKRTKARIAILKQRLHAPGSEASNGILDEQHRAAVRTYENARQRAREYSIASQEESYKRANQKAEKLKTLQRWRNLLLSAAVAFSLLLRGSSAASRPNLYTIMRWASV